MKTTCPSCVKIKKVNIEELEGWLTRSYGNVSFIEYHEKLIDLETEKQRVIMSSLVQEVTGFLWSNGKLEIDFKAFCTECHFSFQYQHKETVK